MDWNSWTKKLCISLMTEMSHSSSRASTTTHYVLWEICDAAEYECSIAYAMLTRESRWKPEMFLIEPPESCIQKKIKNLPQSDEDIWLFCPGSNVITSKKHGDRFSWNLMTNFSLIWTSKLHVWKSDWKQFDLCYDLKNTTETNFLEITRAIVVVIFPIETQLNSETVSRFSYFLLLDRINCCWYHVCR